MWWEVLNETVILKFYLNLGKLLILILLQKTNNGNYTKVYKSCFTTDMIVYKKL